MYISYYIKNLNIPQINLYNIIIYFGLGLSGFQIGFYNIHTLLIIPRVQKILTHLSRVGIHRVQVKLSLLMIITTFIFSLIQVN
jgi:hypothetical protein